MDSGQEKRAEVNTHSQCNAGMHSFYVDLFTGYKQCGKGLTLDLKRGSRNVVAMPFDAHQEGTLLDDDELRLELKVSFVLDEDLVARLRRSKNPDFEETRTAGIVGDDIEGINITDLADRVKTFDSYLRGVGRPRNNVDSDRTVRNFLAVECNGDVIVTGLWAVELQIVWLALVGDHVHLGLSRAGETDTDLSISGCGSVDKEVGLIADDNVAFKCWTVNLHISYIKLFILTERSSVLALSVGEI